MSAQNADPQIAVDPHIYGPFGAIIEAYLPSKPNRNVAGFMPGALMEGMTAPFKGLARIQLEMTGLAIRRAQANMQFPTELVRCRTPRDLVDVQVDFWRTAGEQYTESSRRVMEAWSALVPGAAALVAPASKAMLQRERDYINFGGMEKEGEGEERRARGGSGEARRVA